MTRALRVGFGSRLRIALGAAGLALAVIPGPQGRPSAVEPTARALPVSALQDRAAVRDAPGGLVALPHEGDRGTLVSHTPGGGPSRQADGPTVSGAVANGSSFDPKVSLDGRYVAFASSATNLVADDTNNASDVFVRDRQTGGVARVSVSATGAQADGASGEAAISADGRYVAFSSEATNLVADDTNGAWDVFVKDLRTGGIERVSVSSSGQEGNLDSMRTAISGDGRRVAFISWASNLVAGPTYRCPQETYPPNAKCLDVFVRDLDAMTTVRVSAPPSGDDGQGEGHSDCPAISADGRFVAFCSGRSDLVEGDTNATYDVFVRDLQTGGIERVSVSSHGRQGNGLSAGPSLSADGRYVAFWSYASNLVLGDAEQCERDEPRPAVRVLGMNLMMTSDSCTDVLLRDRASGTTTMVSVSSLGLPGDSDSFDPSISLDGRSVAFTSAADNLAPDDTTHCGMPSRSACPTDVFVRDLGAGSTERVSVSSSGEEANAPSFSPEMSDGRDVVFVSAASNLVEGDLAPQTGYVFLRDRYEHRTEICS